LCPLRGFSSLHFAAAVFASQSHQMPQATSVTAGTLSEILP